MLGARPYFPSMLPAKDTLVYSNARAYPLVPTSTPTRCAGAPSMTISLVDGVNPLQTTLLELGIVSGRVALLLRSAEIQPVFGRFVPNGIRHSPPLKPLARFCYRAGLAWRGGVVNRCASSGPCPPAALVGSGRGFNGPVEGPRNARVKRVPAVRGCVRPGSERECRGGRVGVGRGCRGVGACCGMAAPGPWFDPPPTNCQHLRPGPRALSFLMLPGGGNGPAVARPGRHEMHRI